MHHQDRGGSRYVLRPNRPRRGGRNGPHPTRLALPRNHEWYHRHTAILRLFARRKDGHIGGWRTQQRRSYFAVVATFGILQDSEILIVGAMVVGPEFGPLAAVTPGTPGGLMVMLAEYGKLPHLMHPVVTDNSKAEAILAWAVDNNLTRRVSGGDAATLACLIAPLVARGMTLQTKTVALGFELVSQDVTTGRAVWRFATGRPTELPKYYARLRAAA